MKVVSVIAAAFWPLIVNALSDKARANVRSNFETGHKVVALHEAHTEKFLATLAEEHHHDRYGFSQDHHMLKVSEDALELLRNNDIPFSDVTESFLAEMERNLQSSEFVCEGSIGGLPCSQLSMDDFHNSYQTLQAIHDRLSFLHATYDNTALESIGKSYEQRDLMTLWIGDEPDKPLVFFFCAMHAREWITPMFCLHLAETLLKGEDPRAQELAQNFTFAITPVANPDGYEYSHTTDNLWRKTRKPNPRAAETGREICNGTDPNRNYGYGWGGQGASSDPCQETYRGESAFDQVETKAMKEFSDKYKNRLIHINDVHAYGDYYLCPFGNTVDLPEDFDKMEEGNKAIFDSIKAHNGKSFKVGPVATTIYPASGGSMDYFYGVNDIVFSGAFEGRGSDRIFGNGFQPETSQIKPSNEELFVGTNALLKKIVEIEFYRDLKETNIYINGEMSQCENLRNYCAVENVYLRCPATCLAGLKRQLKGKEINTQAVVDPMLLDKACNDLEFTNIFIEREGNQEGQASSCSNLHNYCSREEVSLRCPTTCNTCPERLNNGAPEMLPVVIREATPESESSSGFPIFLISSFLIMGGMVLGVAYYTVSKMKSKGSSLGRSSGFMTDSSKDENLNHYTL